MSTMASAPTGSLPRRLPLFGHALRLVLRPLEFVEALRDCGDVVVFQLGRKPTYMINNPELVREVLVTQYSKFRKGGPLVEQIARLLGNGLGTSNGDFHHRQRRLAQPAFHHTRIASYATTMRDIASAKADSWSDGLVLDLSHEMHVLTTDTLTKTLLSAPPGIDAAAEVRRSLPIVFEGIGRRAYLPIEFVHKLPTPTNRRFETALRRLHDLVDRVIADYRANATDRGDLVSRLMLARDEDTGETMTDQQLHDEIITMMVAGTETAAATLAWAFHVLGTHPEIERRVHAEIDEVLGGRPASYADLPHLDYLRRVVQETLRVYPVGWLLSRGAVTDVELGGQHIPAGSGVFFSAYALHHDPRLFPQPKSFDPDRWLPDRARAIPRCAYLPFITGARKCIGDSFGFTEVMIALATLAGRWRLRPVPNRPLRSTATTTYRLKESYVTVEPRQPGH